MRIGKMAGYGVALAMVLTACLAWTGCQGTPTKMDKVLGTFTEVPMVTKRDITNVVTVTNFVPREVQVVQTNTVTVTNQVPGLPPTVQVIPVYVTNTLTVQAPVLSLATNFIPAGSTVMVPQMTGPSTATQTGSGVIGAIAGAFGYGGIATTILGGLFGWYQRSRNATLAAAATGATAGQQVMQQAAAGLVENVETLKNILQQTPQGQQVLPLIQNYLVQHQAGVGTLQTVAGLVAQLDEPAAKDSAQEILSTLAALQRRPEATANAKTGI